MTFTHRRRLVRGLNRFHDICLVLSLVLAGSILTAAVFVAGV